MDSFKNNIHKVVSFTSDKGRNLTKKTLALLLTLFSYIATFVLTRPWLSGVTVVCSVLAVMVLGYGPKLEWEEKSNSTDHYFYADDGFVKSNNSSVEQNQQLFKKFESDDVETVELIERRPEFNGPRFTKRDRPTPFGFASHQTVEHDSQRNHTMSPDWSQQVNRSSKTDSIQKPSRVIENKGSILKTSATETATSVWLIGIIEDDAEQLPSIPQKPSSPSEGPMIIQGTR